MPFIRYQTGDVVTLDTPGASGITEHASCITEMYPRIRRIRGRKDETFVTPDGRRLPSLNFYSLLQTYEDILRFQFVQQSPAAIIVKLQMRPGREGEGSMIAELRQEIGKRLGDSVALRIEITDQFVTSADGKTPTFIRSSPANPLAAAEAR
jgi:phenylacetate-coenzyme A ligase PaaK-like adenylate-forming protein